MGGLADEADGAMAKQATPLQGWRTAASTHIARQTCRYAGCDLANDQQMARKSAACHLNYVMCSI